MAAELARAVTLMLSLALDNMTGLHDARNITEFPVGLSHRSWLLDSAIGEVVVRIDTPEASALKLDRRFESDVLRHIANADLAPELLWVDLERGVQVTRYLPGRIWGQDDLSVAGNFVRLATKMALLHDLPIVGLRSDRIETLRSYAAINGGDAAGRLLADAVALSHELDETNPCGLVLCHGDVHVGNIIDDGELRLIDWEYAGTTHRALDLASFARQQELSKMQLSAFLAAYEREAGAMGRKEFTLACALHDCTVLLWLSAIHQVQPTIAGGLGVPDRYRNDLAILLG
jgi:thiamine kinase-like enzyme